MTQPRKVPYLPPLDGLRAVAVIAVLLYHADVSWFSGGFLGVEVFFVISGYLITSLLLREWRETGRVDLRAFWLRRAGRLLPELFVVILLSLAVASIFQRDEVARLRDDASAATFYVMNWRLIFSHQSYFESLGRPSLFQHLWSLAVEEQFYLLWPPIFALSIGRLRPRGVLALALGGATAAAVLMAALYQPDGDVSRIYYGTDTRASGVLIGAALALVWNPWADRRDSKLSLRLPVELAGVAAMAVLLFWLHALDQSSSFLYRGGFAAVGIVTAAGIVAVVHPASRSLAAVFGSRPLRWAGTRSYGIYLWHWPIFMITRAHQDVGFGGIPLFALRLSATFVLAELSYRYVLLPVRSGIVGRTVGIVRGPATGRALSLRAAALGSALSLLIFVGSLAVARQPTPPDYLRVTSFHGVVAARIAPEDDVVPSAPTATSTEEASETPDQGSALDTPTPEPGDEETPAAEATAPPTPTPTPTRPPAPLPKLPAAHLNADVFAVGDSVMIGAAGELGRAGTVEIDAEVGRQASTVVSVLESRKKAGPLPPAVVIHTGNNGTFSRGQLDQMMTTLADVNQVVFVNDKVDRKWEESNNAMMAAAAADYRKLTVVDWHGAANGHSELFADDGLHLTYAGADLYAKLIAVAIHAPPPPTPAPATPSATATPSPSASPSPSSTVTPQATASGTPSTTATTTVTPDSATASATPSRSASPSSPSADPPPAATATPARSASPTPTSIDTSP